MIVPFQELGFVTAFELDELIDANDFSTDNYTAAIYDSLSYFLLNRTKHVDYLKIDEVEYSAIENALQPIYKEDPIPHYGINFPSIHKTGIYEQLLEAYKVDYVMFISKYHIAKKVLFANQSFSGNYAIPWSSHFVDYELYDKGGKLVAMSAKLDLKPNPPTEETYQFKGLAIRELDNGFRLLHRDLWNKIRLFKKKAKTIYRLKKKEYLTPKSP